MRCWRPVGVDGPQHAHLLVAQGVSLEVDGRLHGHQAEQLEHVVLEDVAAGTGLLVEGAAGAHAEVLGHGDLDVVDVAPVPDRLEDAVGEAEDQQVADGVLAQVVVDAIDLRLIERLHDRVVQRVARVEVVAERLLDDDAAPGALRVGQAGSTEVGHDVLVGRRRRGQVEEAVAPTAGRGVDLVQPFGEAGVVGGLAEVALLVVDGLGEVVPERTLDLIAGMLGHGRLHLVGEGGVRVGPARVAHDARLDGQQPGPSEVVEGREDLAVREIAGGAEDDHDGRVWHPLEARARSQRIGRRSVFDRVAVHHVPGTTVAASATLEPGLGGRLGGHRRGSYFSLMAWPPNCSRRAASTWAV